MRIRGEGDGSIELARASGHSADDGRVDGIDFDPRLTAMRFQAGLLGHVGAIPDIVYAEVISSPENGSAYAAGERIDLLVVFTEWVDFPEGTVLPFWLGNRAEHRREAHLVTETKLNLNTLYFSYTVRAGDTDTDGIYIGADPFGDNAGIEFRSEENPAVPAHLTLPANQLAANVNPSTAHAHGTCEAIPLQYPICCTLDTAAGNLILRWVFPAIRPISDFPYVQQGALSASWSFERYRLKTMHLHRNPRYTEDDSILRRRSMMLTNRQFATGLTLQGDFPGFRRISHRSGLALSVRRRYFWPGDG